MGRFDSSGLFWAEPERIRTTKKDDGPRSLPPIPESDWSFPEGPEAYPDLSGQGIIAIDVETKDLHLKAKGPGFIRGDAYICGVAVGTEAGFRQYYPVRHEMGYNLPKEYVFGWLRKELARPNQPKIGANILYDLEALAFEGVKVEGPIYDVQVAEALLDETKLTYNLGALARERLLEDKVEHAMVKWLKAAFGDETNIKKNIYRAPAQVVGPYAEGDVDLPLRLFEIQRRELEEQNLWNLFIMESKLIPMLLAMRLRGVPVNLPHAEKLLGVLDNKLSESLAAIKHMTGVNVDIWAPDSIARMFDKLGVSYPRTAKTDKPSFRKEWLKQHDHPATKLLLEARHAEKFKGTFVQGYILDGHVNGVVHGQFHQLRSDEGGTVSGRFSSSNPNLQNIPTRTKEGKLIREAFIPRMGRTWWKFDWSQVEYRLIVHYAKLRNMPGIDPIVDRYLNDPSVDYHQAVAELTGLSRSDAKNLNFGLAYGQGVDLLCDNLGVDKETGLIIMKTYHEKAPFIKPLSQEVSDRAGTRGFITTLLGRRRRFNLWEKTTGKSNENEWYVSENNLGEFANMLPVEVLKRAGWVDADLRDKEGPQYERTPDNDNYLRLLKRNRWRRAKLHKALNALIQGSAADIMKEAMVNIWESGVCADDLLGAPALTVHDELDGDFEEGNRAHQEALAHVKHCMETVVKLHVPLRADGGTGPNWGALEEAA